MAVRVVQVERAEPPGALARSPLLALTRALGVAALRVLGRLAGRPAPRPEAGPPAEAHAVRGMPVLVEADPGVPRCVACGLCSGVCPAGCIRITTRSRPGGAEPQGPDRFEIDMGRCLFCGLCEEACPEAALVMSPLVEIAAFGRSDLVFAKPELLVPAELLEERLAQHAALRESIHG